jgi:hypothetical protein
MSIGDEDGVSIVVVAGRLGLNAPMHQMDDSSGWYDAQTPAGATHPEGQVYVLPVQE